MEAEPEAAQPRAASFPIVGIGASAGGLAAIEAFFAAMPADMETGMAFVLVQHLDPAHESALTGLLASYLYLPFLQIGGSPSGIVPPFVVQIGWLEALGLSLVFTAVLLITIAGTIYYLVRLKVFQAVKLGEAL